MRTLSMTPCPRNVILVALLAVPTLSMKVDSLTTIDRNVLQHQSVGHFGESEITAEALMDALLKTNNNVSEALLLLSRLKDKIPCPYSKPTCSPRYRYRSFDGSCNNLNHPNYGKAFTPFGRLLPAACSSRDGYWRKAKDGSELPNARLVSELVTEAYDDPEAWRLHPWQTMTMMHFGQFLDHDITLTAVTTVPARRVGYAFVTCNCDANFHPACKPILTPGRTSPCIRFVRSLGVLDLNCTIGSREQLNEITSFIDGSNVYGSSAKEAGLLRDSKKSSGKMASIFHKGEELLPPTEHPTCNNSRTTPRCFAAGDVRANVQSGITSFHTLFVREHNRIATLLRRAKRGWSGEKVFQETRRIVIAEIQHIVYNEYLPQVLGKQQMAKYRLNYSPQYGYDETVIPHIYTEFSTVSYRFGHSIIPNELERTGQRSLPLEDMFFNVDAVYNGGVDSLLHGMSTQRCGHVDGSFARTAREKLFGHGDLVARNVQRGRDHCIPGYKTLAKDLGTLPDLLPCKLSEPYSDDDDIDPYLGGLLERPEDGAAVGPTFASIIGKQFEALKYGDRFFYEHALPPGQLHEIRKVSLSKIICNNAMSVDEITKNAFLKESSTDNPKVACDDLDGLDLSNWLRWQP